MSLFRACGRRLGISAPKLCAQSPALAAFSLDPAPGRTAVGKLQDRAGLKPGDEFGLAVRRAADAAPGDRDDSTFACKLAFVDPYFIAQRVADLAPVLAL